MNEQETKTGLLFDDCPCVSIDPISGRDVSDQITIHITIAIEYAEEAFQAVKILRDLPGARVHAAS